MSRRERRSGRIWAVVMFLAAVIILLPFYLIVVNSFKTLPEIIANVMTLPEKLIWSNFTDVIKKMNFWHALKNTSFITVFASLLHIVFATMAGYWLIRYPTRLNRFLYYLIIAAMAVPFQAVMIPAVSVAKTFGLRGSLWGASFVYLGMGCSTVVFLTYGAVKSIPIELEEAAIIDGCSPLKCYFFVVLPLLRTIVLTFTILNIFWLWNDYLTAQLMLGTKKDLYTLQIALKVCSAEYLVRWDMLLPAIILTMIIPVVVFVFCQRSIIEGMVTGAVKG